MFSEYSKRMLENIKREKGKNQNIDLILEGGAFNGSYIYGALYFLKEMEHQNYISIKRISSTSIGSLSALIYMLDDLDIAREFYSISYKKFKKTGQLNVFDKIFNILRPKMPHNICTKLKNKLYISYYNLKSGKKIIRNKYKNVDDIFNSIRRSCYIPFLVDGNLTLENKYVDGITPYIFPLTSKRKILNISLQGYDKIFKMICIKNEQTNIHRSLNGLLDIYMFFANKSSTSMCSYISDHTVIQKQFYILLQYVEQIIIYFLYTLYHLKTDPYMTLMRYFCI
jgi:predicted patatin/cPLA2 family phospholipase